MTTTTQPTHTPGPWEISENGCSVLGANGGTLICETPVSYWENLAAAAAQGSTLAEQHLPQVRANASLIAAAPELLAAAIAFRGHLVNAVVFKRNDDREKCCKLDAALLAAWNAMCNSPLGSLLGFDRGEA